MRSRARCTLPTSSWRGTGGAARCSSRRTQRFCVSVAQTRGRPPDSNCPPGGGGAHGTPRRSPPGNRRRVEGMRAKFRSQFREGLSAAAPAMILVLVAFWVAAQFVAPAPPKSFAIAAARKGSPYFEAAQRYGGILMDNGVTLEV